MSWSVREHKETSAWNSTSRRLADSHTSSTFGPRTSIMATGCITTGVASLWPGWKTGRPLSSAVPSSQRSSRIPPGCVSESTPLGTRYECPTTRRCSCEYATVRIRRASSSFRRSTPAHTWTTCRSVRSTPFPGRHLQAVRCRSALDSGKYRYAMTFSNTRTSTCSEGAPLSRRGPTRRLEGHGAQPGSVDEHRRSGRSGHPHRLPDGVRFQGRRRPVPFCLFPVPGPR